MTTPHKSRLRRHSDEELLAMLAGLADELGRTPSRREAEKLLPYAGWQGRFGTYRQACELTGLEPNRPLPASFTEDRKVIGFSRRFKILERDGFRCTYCGGSPKDGYVLHVDHVVPRTLGGETSEENLVTACFVCNEGKQDRMLRVLV